MATWSAGRFSER